MVRKLTLKIISQSEIGHDMIRPIFNVIALADFENRL